MGNTIEGIKLVAQAICTRPVADFEKQQIDVGNFDDNRFALARKSRLNIAGWFASQIVDYKCNRAIGPDNRQAPIQQPKIDVIGAFRNALTPNT